MSVMQRVNESIKKGIRSWLNITPANPYSLQITEVMDYELTAIRNRIWYRGDSSELEQMYQQNPEQADKYKFWAAKSTCGMEMRKIHTGLPGLIVRTLVSIIMPDMNDYVFEEPRQEEVWKHIAEENEYRKLLEMALREALYIGDGAWKISYDTDISQYPILEWFPGERVEFVRKRGRIQEVVFKTPYAANGKTYVLHEHYGYGKIDYKLYDGDREVALNTLIDTAKLETVTFDKNVILAVPMRIFDSAKWQGRGGSIFDGKLDNFDAFDEVWSQWMDALRAGRAKTYIPDSLIPKNPHTGEILKPNPFDNRYIKMDSDMGENAKNNIDTEQPDIPHESYLASYITALDLCLQGIISPSTLGIDVKKLDNADAQREKEKTTLYTRNQIVEQLQETLPKLIRTSINAYNLFRGNAAEEIKVDVPFGEYANPSFESQVETVTKGKQGGIMSIEASVEELYGDTRDKEWKAKEVARLKAEQGIAEVEEPSLNTDFGLGGVMRT